MSMGNGPSAAELDRIKAAKARVARAVAAGPPKGLVAPELIAGPEEAAFDEETYLRFNPDVRAAVTSGAFRSGRDHYERYGRAEGRPYQMIDPAARNRIILNAASAPRELARPPVCTVDEVKLSRGGGVFITGWVNDASDALDSVDLYFAGWAVSFDAAALARVRRADTEAALNSQAQHCFGFWGFIAAGRTLPGGQCSVVVRLRSGGETGLIVQAEMLDDVEMRDATLRHLAICRYFGNYQADAAAAIDGAIAGQLIEFNRMVSRAAVSAPYVERFGGGAKRYKGSIVVCLYGRAEYIFLQNAIFGRQAGIGDYEFIYVCNSPELGEQLLKEARLCRHIYGLDQTVLILNSNAGFGAANNLGAAHALSGRVMITNPDVFPRDADWVARHGQVVEQLPPAQTALFGAPLYYDDGSLMHGGMYFDIDQAPDFSGGKRGLDGLLRVEHYGKGAPPDTASFLRPRPVPAVSGAFMSVARPWFEKLGGFTEDFVFGHYEDADLCLKSRAAGCPPWLHDVRLWHLEGKGSSRRAEHEGGSLVNRWLFTKRWGELISREMLGPGAAQTGGAPAEAGA